MKSFSVTVNIESVLGKGEDAHLFNADNYSDVIVIGVFDGLGGRSAGYDEQTGGKIASQKTSETVQEFLLQWWGKLNPEIVREMQDKVYTTLKEAADKNIRPSRLGGSLAGQRLCTTMALASIPKLGELPTKYEVSLAWIGDSRLYFLSPEKGLQQLTQDDLEVKKDAFEMIREDPPMSQYLSADMKKNWQIHFKLQELDQPGCILACTDGCFQYLPAPWEFEKLLLNTLSQSEDEKQWKDLLFQRYQDIKQDDVSLILCPMGYNSFDDLKHSYEERRGYLTGKFDFKNKNLEELKTLWQEYRENYEFYLEQEEKQEIDQTIVEINRDSVPSPEIISVSSENNEPTVDPVVEIIPHSDEENKIPNNLELAKLNLKNNNIKDAIQDLETAFADENIDSQVKEDSGFIQDLEQLLEEGLQNTSNRDLIANLHYFIGWINYLSNNLVKARDYCNKASQYYQSKLSDETVTNNYEKKRKMEELIHNIDNLTQISEGEN
ncbi:protein phosphatase 2C domain-containing protein [Planktothrix agardhii 1032]|jgi:serine/threonine protein phosphatase PrpC|uniref:PP2C family protein-serine/threonine phosphatase n=1 Tax=Planktothrix agardhii TaxID=1160 RepID=UPI001D0B595D|nr:protein phosphatase 2C domain-containing protein [Planktothrix agardhii]MCB8778963.1 protein phosphatase 2C domain-containing protein [Planktothrix agardhii 1031]MCF3597545.1 protein phosphatase 2C domain-containing protein [Planktothrix agardhii 1032]